MKRILGSIVSLFFIILHTVSIPFVNAADWTTWRSDAQRSAATTEQLADQLHLQWTLELPRLAGGSAVTF